MQTLLSKLFRARPGEWGAVLTLQALVFLIICTLLIVKPTASALFLSEYGAVGLPYMFLATAVVAGVVSTVYAWSLRHFSLLRVTVISLVICLGLLVACAILARLPSLRHTAAAALYLWTAIFGVLAASQFWMMANFVFDVRQAKRLFGLIGAGAIAGGIAGGYLTNLLAPVIGTRNLLFLAAGLLVPCLVLTIHVWRYYVRKRESELSRKTKVTEYEAPHRLIAGSNHLLLICAIVALGVITAKLVDYQFSVLAAERYGDQNRLAAFFGFWYSTFNIVALLIQLIATNRVVQRLGISSALMFLPVGLAMGALGMLLMPGLAAATASRAVDGSLKQSLSRASVEMLFLPVDAETKKRVKTYIDVFVDSVAGGIGGLLLIGLTQFLGFTAPQISWFLLVLIAGWGVCILLVREEYLDAFREQLSHLAPREKKPVLKSNHREVMAGFLRVLEEGKLSTHERQLLYVLERSGELRGEEFREPIRQLLGHPSPEVRARALRSLYFQPGTEMIRDVRPLMKDPAPTVRAAAMDYVFSRTEGFDAGELTRLLEHPDVQIAGPALVSLATEAAGSEALQRRWRVGEHLNDRIRQLPSMTEPDRRAWKRFILRASGRSRTPAGRHYLRQSLVEEEPEVVRAAILAAGESQHEELLRPLLSLLPDVRYRKLALSTLVQFGNGLVTLVPKLIQRNVLSPGEIRMLPQVLERIDTRQSLDLLLALHERYRPADTELYLQVIRALNAMQRDFPDRKLPAAVIYDLITTEARRYEKLQHRYNEQIILTSAATDREETENRKKLAKLLRHRLQATFERLMRLIGLRYPYADIIPVHRGLVSKMRREQLSALEFLDNLLEISLKRLIVPLLERRQRQMVPERPRVLPVTATVANLRYAELKALRRMARGRDERLRVAALRLMGSLTDERYLAILGHYAAAADESPRVRRVASAALEKLRETLADVDLSVGVDD